MALVTFDNKDGIIQIKSSMLLSIASVRSINLPLSKMIESLLDKPDDHVQLLNIMFQLLLFLNQLILSLQLVHILWQLMQVEGQQLSAAVLTLELYSIEYLDEQLLSIHLHLIATAQLVNMVRALV